MSEVPGDQLDVKPKSPVPIWFWIMGVIFLLWNLVGLMAFVGQMMMTEESIAKLPEGQQMLYRDIPGWVTACFAIAVTTGIIGCVLILMRKRLAIVVLAISLVGVLGQNFYSFVLTDAPLLLPVEEMILPGVVILIAIVLLPYSLFCQSCGLLK